MESSTSTTKKPKQQRSKRIRRTAAQARRLILEAAERRLATQGPEGIRLQEIARDVGISHPAILHHFENREGLVRALAQHIADQLRGKLVTILKKPHETAAETDILIGNLFEALSDRGNARALAWLIMTNSPVSGATSADLVDEITNRVHKQRCAWAKERGTPPPPREDTLFLMLLSSCTAFGDAYVGRLYREQTGAGQETALRFRAWFSQLLASYADTGKPQSKE